jgi:hypothetical protein
MGLNAISGKNAIVYLAGTGTSAIAMSEQTDYQLDLVDTFVDVTSLPNATGMVWNTQIKGSLGWTGKLSGNFDTTTTNLWDASVSGSAMNMYLYPSASTMTAYYYGTTFVTLKPILSGGVKKAITNAVDLNGTGTLSRN